MVVPVMWRTQKQRYSLQAEVCPHCTSAVFPPRAVCPYCKQPMAAEHGPRAQQPVGAAAQGREFVYALPAGLPVGVPAAGDD